MEIYAARSDEANVEPLVKKLREAARKLGVFAQAFGPELIVSERHLLLAYEVSSRAFREGTNLSNNLENEVLTRAAASTRINEAIKIIGVKDPEHFLLLTNAKGEKLKKLLESIGASSSKPKFKPEIATVKKTFGITSEMLKNYSLGDIVLEAVAMAGNEN